MTWWKRNKSAEPIPDDIDQARAMRREATAEYAKLRAQAPAVKRMTQSILNRGVRNHFGEDIQITFVRK